VGVWDRSLKDWLHVEELEGTSRTPDSRPFCQTNRPGSQSAHFPRPFKIKFRTAAKPSHTAAMASHLAAWRPTWVPRSSDLRLCGSQFVANAPLQTPHKQNGPTTAHDQPEIKESGV
jgi:hypothetical protein